MNNLFIYGILFCLLQMMLGCTKENDHPLNPPDSIMLLSPINDEIVDSCCFAFEWQILNATSDYQFTLSESEIFEVIILDTTVETSGFFYSQKLKPNTKYFWKVRSSLLSTEAIETFVTRDFIEGDIDLLFPKNGEIVDYWCFTFSWQSSNVVSDYQLMLSEDKNFDTIILDTINEPLSYYQHQKLRPGRKYFWKVSSNQLQSESLDSFYTQDYLAYFKGSYVVDVLIQNWNWQQGVTWDTMFEGNLVIEKNTEEIVQVYETTTGKGRTYSYNPNVNSGENSIVFLYDDASRSSLCSFNYSSDTFGASVIEGGVGTRKIYSFTGKKE